ncbi:MAG: hypothetical protein WC608_05220 [Parcubacteria group bacterium]
MQKIIGDYGWKQIKIASSRDADGNVWIVDWNDSKMKVNRNNPDNHNDN